MLKFPSDPGGWPSWTCSDKGHQKFSIDGPTVSVLPDLSRLSFGEAYQQRLKQHGSVVKGRTVTLARADWTSADNPLQRTTTAPGPSWESLDETTLIEKCEDALTKYRAVKLGPLEYVTCSGQHPRRRSALGLPETPLSTSRRLLATHNHIPGVHSSQVRVNLGASFVFLHKQEVDLQSVTMLWSGDPVLWIVVPPRQASVLEGRLAENLKLPQACSQFVRHGNLLVPPSALYEWEITFDIFLQRPGEVVRTDYLSYQWAWNTGPNVVESISYCEADWCPSPIYRHCRKSSRNCGSSPITAEAMVLGQYRPLDVVEEWDEDIIDPQDDEVTTPDHDSDSQSESTVTSPTHDSPSCDCSSGGKSLAKLELKANNASSGPPANRPLQAYVQSEDEDSEMKDVDDDPSPPQEPELQSPSNDSSTTTPVNVPMFLDSDDDTDEDVKGSAYSQPVSSPRNQCSSDESISKHDEWQPGKFYRSTNFKKAALRPAPLPTFSPGPQTDSPTGGLSDLFVTNCDEPTSSEQGDAKSGPGLEKSVCGTSDPFQSSPPLFPALSVSSSEPSGTPHSHPDPTKQCRSSGSSMSPDAKAADATIISIASSQASSPLFSGFVGSRHSYNTPPSTAHTAQCVAVTFPALDRKLPEEEMIQDIDRLIELGCRNRGLIPWVTTHPQAVERMLNTFRPGQWLNDDAVMECLYRMAMDRCDVHVVESHDFNAAYIQKNPARICRWQTPSTALVPVHVEQTSHWFLVSLHFTHRQLTVHDYENERSVSVAHFILSGAPELSGWTVRYSSGSINDGNNCGVILLHEADKILGHTDPSPPNFVALRRRYIQLIVASRPTEAPQATSPSSGNVSTTGPSSWGLVSPSPDPCAGSKPNFKDLPPQMKMKFLASSMGCREVWEDFRDLVCILKDQSLRFHSDTQRTMQLYNSSRSLRQDVLSGRTPSNVTIQNALRLYDTISSPGHTSEVLYTSIPGGDQDGLQVAVQLYTRGRGYTKLGSLTREFGALSITSTYRALMRIFQNKSNPGASEDVDMQIVDRTEPAKQGQGSDTLTYKYMLKCTGQDEDPKALRRLQRAICRGNRLHHFEDICGPGRPLWMLRPIRTISCPLDPDYTIRPACYEKLNKRNIQTLVDSVRDIKPRLWDFLPRCGRGIERMLAGEGVDDGFIEEFESLFSG
ncbi:uncharacterized protein PV06_11249 [Exophiala oligosperma]|uniref:Ubiquitin-like protease family profile domain-containing protein n=1 Tax=Exophiala oligosperma TaxID=215243 RepID=A0A0D2D2U2_9EURO|nr:uncharacterized protein PV06_11249 [Exophiala oligosperma]KIW36540.1 hypothetical protein PV06_11249 [Exophiala oligosperma]